MLYRKNQMHIILQQVYMIMNKRLYLWEQVGFIKKKRIIISQECSKCHLGGGVNNLRESSNLSEVLLKIN